jgi:hypothetical protein
LIHPPPVLTHPPPFLTHHLVERPPVGDADRRQRAAGRVAEGDQERARPVLREAEHLPGEFLVADRRVPAAYPEASRGEHDAHRGLPEIEPGALQAVGRRDHRDRRGRPCDVPGCAPDLRQLGQLPPVGDHDEVPGLPVPRGRRPPAGLQDLLEVRVGDRPLVELPDVAPRRDRVPHR